MTDGKHRPEGAPKTERRAGKDRRKVDKGPQPGKRERRIHLESRKPDVQELEVTPSAWAELCEQLGKDK